MVITPEEKRHYPLKGKDREILRCIHDIESIENLSLDERFFLHFLRSQLERDWRTPCLRLLKKWQRNRSRTPAERWEELRKLQKEWWQPATRCRTSQRAGASGKADRK
jgi:hypothetical protein